jgi:hypothetical protein
MEKRRIDAKKVEELHAKAAVVDGHNHLLMELTDQQNKDEGVTFENFCSPLLVKGGVNVIVTSIGGDNPCLTNFSDLMLNCGLDPGSETGLFLYHLSKLMEQDLVKKRYGKYESTERGDEASRLLRSLAHPYINSQVEEGGEKMRIRKAARARV